MSPSISILSHKHLTILRLQEIKDMIVLKHLIRGNSNGCPDGFGTVKDSLHGHDEQARMILKPHNEVGFGSRTTSDYTCMVASVAGKNVIHEVFNLILEYVCV